MNKMIFQNDQFELNGVLIPEFTLIKGKLIRIYVPNFDSQNNPLGHQFCIELIKRFKQQKPEFQWAKEYPVNTFFPFLNLLTVKKYLTKKMHIDKDKAHQIIKIFKVNPYDKIGNLDFGMRKALAVAAEFENTDCILFDYYGVSAMEIKFVEKIVNNGIENGKAAIGFDRLEYAVDKEPYENIEAIRVILCDKSY